MGENSIFPNGKNMRSWQKMVVAAIGALAVAVPAWFGAASSWDTRDVDAASAKARKADDKAELAFELLAQKIDFELRSVNEKVGRLEQRLDKLEEKLDAVRFAQTSRGARQRSNIEVAVEPSKETSPEPAKVVQSTPLPKDLETALILRKKEPTNN